MQRAIFIADGTIPGLCACDLARQAADAIIVAPPRHRGHDLAGHRRAFRRALRGLDRRLLRDIGIDLGSA